MAAAVKYYYGTEAQILALVPTDALWEDKAFYYPNDKDYFYQALDDNMHKYGGGESAGVGVKVNGAFISGSKQVINVNEVLDVPADYEYNTHRLSVDGIINCDGEINIL